MSLAPLTYSADMEKDSHHHQHAHVSHASHDRVDEPRLDVEQSQGARNRQRLRFGGPSAFRIGSKIRNMWLLIDTPAAVSKSCSLQAPRIS